MSLDLNRLEKVRQLPGGVVQARCPACAEGGGDQKGEHLRVYPDGRFGCCVHPKEREHRRRIHALAGANGPRVIEVRVATANTGGTVASGILGRLGRVFRSPTVAQRGTDAPDASDGVAQVKANPVAAVPAPRTARTGVSDSKLGGGSSDASDGVNEVQDVGSNAQTQPRTPRTGVSKSNQGGAGNSRTLRTPLNPEGTKQVFFGDAGEETYKEFAPPVRSVRGQEGEMDFARGVRGVRGQESGSESGEGFRGVREQEHGLESAKGVRSVREGEEGLPYLTPGGTLVIPFDSPERYHWWKGGQSVKVTLAEVRERLSAARNP